MKNIVFSIITIGLLSGCVSSGTAFSIGVVGMFVAGKLYEKEEVKVILLPEEGGKVGVISLTDDKGKEYTIDKPYEALSISKVGIKTVALDKEEVDEKYADLIEALPKKLQNYYFFFDTESSNLSTTQLEEIKNVAKTISSNAVHKVICIGHSDSTGSNEINEKISKNRAKAVADQLIANGVDENLITLKYYGDSVPLVKTEAGASNDKNRRVEVVLK